MASDHVLKRSDTIADNMPDALKQSRYHMKRCFARFVGKGKRLMKGQNIMEEVEKSIQDKLERDKVLGGMLGYILVSTKEAAVVPPYVGLAIRPNPGYWEYVKVNADDLSVDGISALDFLKFKETIFDENWANDENALEINFGAIDFLTPRTTLPSSIGNGLTFISKFMSSKLTSNSANAKHFLQYLQALRHRGEKLMIDETLDTVEGLQGALIVAESHVSTLPKETPFLGFEERLKEWGFEKGWGDTAERVRETMRTVSEVLQAPDPKKLELIFSRLPTIFNIVIFSPHGYFGQADVLGLPDTGGQVYQHNQSPLLTP